MAGDAVTVVLPCLNEEESLPAVLAAIPAGYRALVVDNNSTDDTATVAARHGAQVVVEPRPGYGSAVHAGVLAATTPIVAVIDADGSMDAGDLPKLVAELDKGADLVTGRRRPVAGLHWPWVARVGTVVMSWRLRTRHRLPVHDIAPMRVARRRPCWIWALSIDARVTRWSCWSGPLRRAGVSSNSTSVTVPGPAANPRSAVRCGAASSRSWTSGR
ncbi:dolichyl-phosphate sugar synthase [Mycobacterium tuberculosis SUMu012]|nr:dolichyl-phosphate sugar synthase [Mycobacterium tuberculosis SUMu012]